MSTGAGSRVSLVPNFLVDDPAWKRSMASWALEVNQGHIQNTGNVTLASGTVNTVVTDYRAGANSFIGFMPTTSAAAATMGSMYVSARGKQTFTVTHANNGSADRVFVYCILG